MITVYVAEYHRFGGSQRAMLGTVRELRARGIQVQVVFPGDGPATDRYRAAGVPLVVLSTPPSLNRFGGFVLRAGTIEKARVVAAAVRHSAAVYRHMRSTNSRILHCNTARSTLMSAAVPRLMGLRTVWHVRAQSDAVGRLVHRACVLLSYHRVAICEYSMNELPNRARRTTSVIYDGVDVADCRRRAKSTPFVAAEHCPEGASRTAGSLVMVASLTPFKGHHRLLEALSLVTRATGVEPCAFIVGSASPSAEVERRYERYLQARSEQLSLHHVHFLGWMEDPLACIAASDVVVLPSLDHDQLSLDGELIEVRGGEAFPAVVLEAMALNRPVVATRNAGIPEQVEDGVTGLLVDQRADDQLAEAMARLFGDPGLRDRMGVAALERVRSRFSRSVTVDQLIELYGRLAS